MHSVDDYDTRSMASSQKSFLDLEGPKERPDPVELFRETVQAQRDAIAEREGHEGNGLSGAIKQTLTIDLSRRSVNEIPEQVVDIIKVDVERYRYTLRPHGHGMG